MQKQPEPCALVVFGSTGDLMRSRLAPAVYSLAKRGVGINVLGLGRKEKTAGQFRDEFKAWVGLDDSWIRQSVYYQTIDLKSGNPGPLAETLENIRKEHATEGNILFYFALPPDQFVPAAKIAEKIRAGGWRRVIIEKPFGTDLQSAREINSAISGSFGKENVFRIDHYMGKSLVENIMILRFANDIFEPLWNSRHIDSVQVTVSEPEGVGSRGNYYERVGALKDMVQSHLFQVLTLLTMEPPKKAEDMKQEKASVLKKMRVTGAVLGQYGDGIIAGQKVPGYRKEVSTESATETFAAMKVEIDNARWAGVPFYLRTGKRLPEDITKIYVHFKKSSALFEAAKPNMLVINVEPGNKISLQFNLRAGENLVPVNMDFSHAGEFGNTPQAYERLLYDAISGDASLFTEWEEIEEAWKIIDALDADRSEFPNYAAGTWGPPAADMLLKKDGREWINF